MGGGACLIIIREGQLAYAVAEILGDRYDVETKLLEAAINASCESVSQASIYNAVEEELDIPEKILKEIIHLHKKIIELSISSNEAGLQDRIDDLTDKLYKATRKIPAEYETESSYNLEKLRDDLGIGT